MTNRQTIDARGAFCPGPLMELIAAIKLANVGDTIEVLSGDKGSKDDIPAWIKKVGHEMVSVEEHDGYWALVVKKAK